MSLTVSGRRRDLRPNFAEQGMEAEKARQPKLTPKERPLRKTASSNKPFVALYPLQAVGLSSGAVPERADL
jgi:hypothetical protein